MKADRETKLLTRSTSVGDLRVPLVTITGAREGPTLTILAGVHGAEYAGMNAVVRLSREIDPEQLAGNLRIVPVANVPGFLARREVVCPVDDMNLGRCFPGDPDGTYSMRLAHFIWTSVVEGSDFLIDVHGGDIFESLVPYIGLTMTDNEDVNAKSRAMGIAYSLPYVVEFKTIPGEQKGTAQAHKAARNAGIPAILAECGGDGVLREEDALRHIQGLKNVMHHLGMITDEPVHVCEPREMRTDFWRIQHEGFVHPTLELNQHVRPGDPIGWVTDWYGETLEELTAPEEAWVIAIVTTLAARKNAIIYQVAVE